MRIIRKMVRETDSRKERRIWQDHKEDDERNWKGMGRENVSG